MRPTSAADLEAAENAHLQERAWIRAAFTEEMIPCPCCPHETPEWLAKR